MEGSDLATMTQFPEQHVEEPGPEARSTSPTHDVEKVATEGSSTLAGKEPSPRDLHGLEWIIFVASILSFTFLFSLDNTIVADIQPAIFQRFGEIETLSWLGVSLGLGSAVTIFPWCKAYGVFNIKWLYIFHVFLFEVGSALCGGANTMNTLIVGRAIAGAGGCGIYVGGLTYLSVTTSLQERPVYMGATGLIWGLGTVLGPVVGGALADSGATWRWAFYFNLAIGIISAPAFFFLLPGIDLQVGTASRLKISKQTDWLGIVMFIGVMICFIMAVNFGGTVYKWDSGLEITLWLLAGVFFVAFGISQLYHPFVSSQHKLYPTHFLKRPVLVILQVMVFCASGCTVIPIYYIPLFFQFVKGDTALQAAVRLLPFICMLVLFSLLNGSLMAKFGDYMPWYFWGGACIVVGSSLMYTVDAHTSSSAVYGYSIFMGVGTGSYLQASYGVSQALVDPTDLPNAVGFISISQSVGAVVFLAVAGTVFNNKIIEALVPILPGIPVAEAKAAIAGTRSEVFENLDTATRLRMVEAIVGSMDTVYAVMVVGGALTFGLALFLPRQRLFIGHATVAG